MKRLLALVLIVLFASVIPLVQAEEGEEIMPKRESKTYGIGDGGIVTVFPSGNGMFIRILYEDAVRAPLKAKEHLGIDKPNGKFKGVNEKFTVKISDNYGNLICKQSISYNDFSLGQSNGEFSVILEYRPTACGRNPYENLGGVAIEY